MTTVDEPPRYRHVIDGGRVEAASGRRYDSVDPYLGAPWASAADGDAADVDLAVAAALMRRLGDLIARDADRLAEIETRDSAEVTPARTANAGR